MSTILAREDETSILTKDDFDGLAPRLLRAALTDESGEAQKSYRAFIESGKRYIDKEPTRDPWTPEEYGPVRRAGTAILDQAKSEYDLVTTRLLGAVRDERLSMDDRGLGSLGQRLQDSRSPNTPNAETDQVKGLWSSARDARDAELIDAFDKLIRCILPTEALASFLGRALRTICEARGDLSTASVKQSWTQVGPVWRDATALLETRLGLFMDKLATAIESEEEDGVHSL